MAAAASPLDVLVGAPLNHLLRASSWARESLQPHAGRTVCVRCLPFSVSLRIVDSGEVAPAVAGASPDATLTVTPGLLLRMAARDDNAWRDIVIDGDTALAGAVHHLWRHLRWDVEEDLSRIVGDIAAHRMTGSAQTMAQWAKMSGENFMRSLTEYWTEERPAVAAAGDLSRFAADVDALRDDLARIEKRISRLATH